MLKHWRRHSWAAYKRRLQRSSLPILVGPWRSELGFEALYWIPFVQALGIDPDRLIPITRGGAGDFYHVPQALELFALREPKDCRIEAIRQFQTRKTLKQLWLTDFDRAILKDAAAKLGLTRYLVLHPAWMYQVLGPFWEGRTGLEWLWSHLLRARDVNGERELSLDTIPAPKLPEGVTLPKSFIAARFYIRSTYPHAEATVATAKLAVRHLATEKQPVILLNSPVHADEHLDIEVADVPHVHYLRDLVPMTPQNNLALQAAVLGRAQGFVGTYGGLAQLALRLGRPSISFYLDWQGTALAHKHLADAMATVMKVSTSVVRLTDVPLLKAALPPLQIAAPTPASDT